MNALRHEALPGRLRTALWIAALIWITGMATLFPLGNPGLDAVSVFTFDRLAYLVVVALALLAVARDPSLLRQGARVEAMMALYLVVVVLSWATTLSGKRPGDVKRDVDLLLQAIAMPFGAFLIARHAGWTSRQVRISYGVVVVGIGAFLAVVGFVQSFVDWQFLVSPADQDFHASRARGPFSNAVPYSVVVAILLTGAVVLHAHEGRRPLRWLLAVLVAALVEALVLGQVRIVWGAVVLAMLYFAAIHPPMRRSAAVVALGLTALIGIAVAGLDPAEIASSGGASRRPHGKIGERIGETAPLYNRVAVYLTATNMIAHRPLFGFGFGEGTFVRERAPYYASCCGVSPEFAVPCAVPHNEVLNLLVLTGALGLAVYLGLLREIWRLLTAARAQAAAPFGLAMAVATQSILVFLIVTAQLHDVMYLTAAQTLFFFQAGLVAPAPRVR